MLKRATLTALILLLLQIQYVIGQNSVGIIEVPELEKIIEPEAGKLKVINFWATWCKPCIKELPYFVEAQKEFTEVEFIYISLDFADKIEKVDSFAKKKGLDKGEMYLIDDLDYNSWIDKVSPDWSGAIPGTLFVSEKGKEFFEKEFHSGELNEIILNKK